jgi:hypothetical protein
MHAFIQSIVEWFKTGSLLGIPRTGWALLTLVALVDIICAHVKNPKLNHVAGLLALLVQKIVTTLRISQIPMFGPTLIGILNVIIGVPMVGLPPPASVPVPREETPTPPERPAGPPKAA